LDLFALYAGPIQRFEQFTECWDTLSPVLMNQHDRLKALARLMFGVLKVSVLGVLALRISEKGGGQQIYARSVHGLILFALLFYAYPAYIYFNFSGYCDVVISGAAMVGIKLPENFNHPYLARNPIDFWTRWHMSLTNWIRDYIFTPLYKKGVENSIMKPAQLGYVCFFIALFLAGVWHGSTWNFVVFGVLHGCGVSITKMWEEHLIRKRGRPGLKSYLASKPVRFAATFATVNFVCFTLMFFPTDLEGRLKFLWLFATGRP
jgi:D-alanyl-lipoteichoic acid acyltransferase DltB (MBOAT superfamily)